MAAPRKYKNKINKFRNLKNKRKTKMLKNKLNIAIISSLFLLPSISFASANIGSVRANLSNKELKALYQNENRGKRFSGVNVHKDVDVKIGSVRAGLSNAELKKLVHDENRGKRVVGNLKFNVSDVKIGSVRASLSDVELLNLEHNENRG